MTDPSARPRPAAGAVRTTAPAAAAAALLFLTATAGVRAGDFVYLNGLLRDGWYGGTIQLGGEFGTISGSCDPTPPGDLDRVRYEMATIDEWPDPGTAVAKFYNKGWSSEVPGNSNPMLGWVSEGTAEFEMEAYVTTCPQTGDGSESFSAGYAGGPMRITSTTGDAGLEWDLVEDPGFDQEIGDYVRVNLLLDLTFNMWDDGTEHTAPYSDFYADLSGGTTGPGDVGDFEVLRNGETVWTAGLDAPLDGFDPTASVSFVARYGDVVGIRGGVVTGVRVDDVSVAPLEPGESLHHWGSTTTLHGNLTVQDVPGTKPSKPIMPLNLFDPFPHEFAFVEVGEDELGVDDPLWFATMNAPEYVTDTVDPFGPNETIEAVRLPDLGDGLFEVWVLDPVTGEEVLYEDEACADELIGFPWPVEKVIIKGFEADPAWPMVTPVGLYFTPWSEPGVYMIGTPEPATLVMLVAGTAALLLRRRR